MEGGQWQSIQLRNDDKTLVQINEDIWQFDWTQENYIHDEWQYRKAMLVRWDLIDIPAWLDQGVKHLNYLESLERDG